MTLGNVFEFVDKEASFLVLILKVDYVVVDTLHGASVLIWSKRTSSMLYVCDHETGRVCSGAEPTMAVIAVTMSSK